MQIVDAALFLAFYSLGVLPSLFLAIVQKLVDARREMPHSINLGGRILKTTVGAYADALAKVRKEFIDLGLAFRQNQLGPKQRLLAFDCLVPMYASHEELIRISKIASSRKFLQIPDLARFSAPAGKHKSFLKEWAKSCTDKLWSTANEYLMLHPEQAGNYLPLAVRDPRDRFLMHLIGVERYNREKERWEKEKHKGHNSFYPKGLTNELGAVLGSSDGFGFRAIGNQSQVTSVTFINQVSLAYSVFVANLREESIDGPDLLACCTALLTRDKLRYARVASWLNKCSNGSNWIKHKFHNVWKVDLDKPKPTVGARRTAPTTEVVSKHFDDWGQALRIFEGMPDPEVQARILNMDESHGEIFKLLHKSYRFPGIGGRANVGGTKHSHVSLTAVISADGRKYPAYVTIPGSDRGSYSRLSKEWFRSLPEVLRKNIHISRTKNGWTDSKVMCGVLILIAEHFVQETGLELSSEKPLLLVLDNCPSHATAEVLKMAFSLHIQLFFLPPYSTHALQPLDIGVFGPLKNGAMVRAMADLKQQKLIDALKAIETVEDVNYKFYTKVHMRKIHELLGIYGLGWNLLHEQVVKSAFAKAGLYPLNPDIVLTSHWVQRADLAAISCGKLVAYQTIAEFGDFVIEAGLLEGAREVERDSVRADEAPTASFIDNVVLCSYAKVAKEVLQAATVHMASTVVEKSQEVILSSECIKSLKRAEFLANEKKLAASLLVDTTEEANAAAAEDIVESGRSEEIEDDRPFPDEDPDFDRAGEAEEASNESVAHMASASSSRTTPLQSNERREVCSQEEIEEARRVFSPSDWIGEGTPSLWDNNIAFLESFASDTFSISGLDHLHVLIKHASSPGTPSSRWEAIKTAYEPFSKSSSSGYDTKTLEKFVNEAIKTMLSTQGFNALLRADPDMFAAVAKQVEMVALARGKLIGTAQEAPDTPDTPETVEKPERKPKRGRKSGTKGTNRKRTKRRETSDDERKIGAKKQEYSSFGRRRRPSSRAAEARQDSTASEEEELET